MIYQSILILPYPTPHTRGKVSGPTTYVKKCTTGEMQSSASEVGKRKDTERVAFKNLPVPLIYRKRFPARGAAIPTSHHTRPHGDTPSSGTTPLAAPEPTHPTGDFPTPDSNAYRGRHTSSGSTSPPSESPKQARKGGRSLSSGRARKKNATPAHRDILIHIDANGGKHAHRDAPAPQSPPQLVLHPDDILAAISWGQSSNAVRAGEASKEDDKCEESGGTCHDFLVSFNGQLARSESTCWRARPPLPGFPSTSRCARHTSRPSESPTRARGKAGEVFTGGAQGARVNDGAHRNDEKLPVQPTVVREWGSGRIVSGDPRDSKRDDTHILHLPTSPHHSSRVRTYAYPTQSAARPKLIHAHENRRGEAHASSPSRHITKATPSLRACEAQAEPPINALLIRPPCPRHVLRISDYDAFASNALSTLLGRPKPSRRRPLSHLTEHQTLPDLHAHDHAARIFVTAILLVVGNAAPNSNSDISTFGGRAVFLILQAH
ncbi:hypothetical protein R3P38DRAFT_3602377 [Favolaschia claudopus]|uniref:Uncharacterized protein n=1 Tax=Favolaschia claudopus TaxID=2862362 RepID=A0AAW0AAU4_9AGAR